MEIQDKEKEVAGVGLGWVGLGGDTVAFVSSTCTTTSCWQLERDCVCVSTLSSVNNLFKASFFFSFFLFLFLFSFFFYGTQI